MTRLSGGDWLSAGEVAALLGVSRRRVNQLIEKGKIPHQTTALGRLILRRDAEAFAKLDRPVGYPKGKPRRGRGGT
jgi:excisionase family DNA binding protein